MWSILMRLESTFMMLFYYYSSKKKNDTLKLHIVHSFRRERPFLKTSHKYCALNAVKYQSR